MAENAKIKIGFVNNTLYIYNKEMIQYLGNQEELNNNSIETDLYNVLCIRKLYDFFKENKYDIEKKWGININNIITDFKKGKDDAIYDDKATFAVALYIALKNIDLQKKIFSWKNITFKNTVNMSFDTKGMIVTMRNCEFQGYVNFHNSIFDKSADFRRAKFKKLVSFYGVTFSGDRANFLGCEFQDDVDFRDSKFEKSAYFRGAKFEKAVSFYRVTFSGYGANFLGCEFQGYVYFNNSKFKNSADFRVAKFKNNVYFSNSKFKNSANFSRAKFKNNVYFNGSIFNKSAYFRGANFEKVANFYGATFNETPNFSQAIFNGSLNLVNTNLNFDFNSVKKRIIKECYNRNRNVNQQKDKEIPRDKQKDKKIPRENVANDFRDSFRNFKSALIKDNNLLDASNFHKVELYCKEIELGYKKPPRFSKDWIDKIQLLFYRHISDHHTNLVKIIHNTILMIGFFAWLFCIAHLDSVNSFLNNFNHSSYRCFYALLIILMLMVIIGLFVFLCFLIKPLRALINVFMYSGFIGLILNDPKCIFGIANLFNSTTPIQSILMTIYSIVAFIFIFSLQKTARRNSIIPN